MFFKKEKIILNKNILKNDLPLLVNDSRWEQIISITKKSSKIVRLEKKLQKYLKIQEDNIAIKQTMIDDKKIHMDTIISLTDEVYFKMDEKAYNKMKNSEIQIKDYNEKIEKIDNKLEKLSTILEEINFKILSETCNVIYRFIKVNKGKINKIEDYIDKIEKNIQRSIEKKHNISTDISKAYSHFHNLIGGEEIELLDKLYLGKQAEEQEEEQEEN
jgi:hypothetical protein